MRGFTYPLILVSLVAAGCGSGIDVNYDYDLNARFSDYKTYDWIPQSSKSEGDAKSAIQSNTLITARIKNAVSAQLAAKGLVESTEDPDVMMVFHTGVEDQINVTDWGYTYGDYYWGWGGRAVDVYQYKEGTLVIDMIKTDTKELLWRGWATKALADRADPEQVQQTINEVVAAIFKKYPPGDMKKY